MPFKINFTKITCNQNSINVNSRKQVVNKKIFLSKNDELGHEKYFKT